MKESLVRAIQDDPFYEECIYPDCMRMPEWEHALYFAGKKINEKFAIVPVCPYHHRHANNLRPVDKRLHEYHALRRMTEEDKEKYPIEGLEQKLKHLIKEIKKEYGEDYVRY